MRDRGVPPDCAAGTPLAAARGVRLDRRTVDAHARVREGTCEFDVEGRRTVMRHARGLPAALAAALIAPGLLKRAARSQSCITLLQQSGPAGRSTRVRRLRRAIAQGRSIELVRPLEEWRQSLAAPLWR